MEVERGHERKRGLSGGLNIRLASSGQKRGEVVEGGLMVD